MAGVIWGCTCQPGDFAIDVARRFVAETFGADRDVRFMPDSRHFTFIDAAWQYRLDGPEGGIWSVVRTNNRSPRGEVYHRARHESRGTLHGEQAVKEGGAT